MPLSLTKRDVKGSPITISEHDQNLTDIETLVNELEVLVGGEDVPAAETRLTAAELDIDNLQADVTQAEADIVDHEGRIVIAEAHGDAVTGNPHAVTKAQIELDQVTNDAQLKRAAGDFSTFSAKAAPVGADVVLLEDSEDTGGKAYALLEDLPVNPHEHSNDDLTGVPAIEAGDAGKVIRVNAGEDGLELYSPTTADADTVDGLHAAELLVGGFKNKIINGNPLINTRAYVSGVATTAANQYTLDRWRVVTSGQNISWSTTEAVRVVTAPAGGVEQVIEGNSILSGTYTLSWVGTATATVDGTAITNGGQCTLTGGTNATVKFSSGTFSLVQLEAGSVTTAFEKRPVGIEAVLCGRYSWKGNGPGSRGKAYAAGAGVYFVSGSITFPVALRTAPTMSVLTAPTCLNCGNPTFDDITTNGATLLIDPAGAGDYRAHSGVYFADAEI